MSNLFKTLVYQPLFNILILLINLTGNLGISVIILTVVFRLLLWPLFDKNEVMQHKMKEIQPKVKEIQTKHKEDMQTQSKELMKLYKENDIKTGSSFLFMIIQITLLLALINVFRIITQPQFATYMYDFIKLTKDINYVFLGINLQAHSLLLAIVAALSQMFQGMVSLKGYAKNDPQRKTMLMITFFIPFILIAFFKSFEAIIFLYWAVFNLISIIQTMYIQKRSNKK